MNEKESEGIREAIYEREGMVHMEERTHVYSSSLPTDLFL